MLLKRLTLTMATSLLALAGTVGTATAAPAGWLQAEVVSSTADVPACLPA
ncbi:hypothetical protein [Streptomyces chartreusis]